MPAVIKQNYLDRNHGKAFLPHDKIQPNPGQEIQGATSVPSKEIFTLPEKKKKSVYSIHWHDSMGDTVSALLDLDTESSIYQA